MALVLAWSSNGAMVQSRTSTDAAIRFEKLSAIEIAAENCQPPSREAKLTDGGTEFAIVTTVDAASYGQAEVRNTVLQHEGRGDWQSLVELAGVLAVGAGRARGYRELVLGGPGYCGNEIYRWNGKTYGYACNQADDADGATRAMCKSRSNGIRWCKARH